MKINFSFRKVHKNELFILEISRKITFYIEKFMKRIYKVRYVQEIFHIQNFNE